MNVLPASAAPQQAVPAVLFKYLRPERIDVLQSRRIRFTQPTALNDPFELRAVFDTLLPDDSFEALLRPDDATLDEALYKQYLKLPEHIRAQFSFDWLKGELRKRPGLVETALAQTMPLMRQVVRQLIPRIKEEMNSRFQRDIGILSLTESPTNPVMWAHYGDNHRGFLLGFDTASGFFNRRRTEKDEFYYLRPVKYIDRSKNNASLVDMDGSDIFATKASDWAYEREWRVLAPLSTEGAQVSDNAVVLFDFPASALSEIVIGAKAEGSLRRSLELVARDPSMSHVRLRQTYFAHEATEVQIKDIGRGSEDV